MQDFSLTFNLDVVVGLCLVRPILGIHFPPADCRLLLELGLLALSRAVQIFFDFQIWFH